MVGAQYVATMRFAAPRFTDEKSHALLFEAGRAELAVATLSAKGHAARKVPA